MGGYAAEHGKDVTRHGRQHISEFLVALDTPCFLNSMSFFP